MAKQPTDYAKSELDRMVAIESSLKTYWGPRDTMMKKDRSLIALTEPPKVPGFTRVTLNRPKVLWDTSVSLLSSFEPIMRLPWESPTQEEDERARLNKAERFLIGMMRELDKHQFDEGKDSWLWELAYWACSGWVVCFPLMENGTFTARFYDPLTVYPEWGPDGLVRLLRSYWMQVGFARQMALDHNWTVDFTKVPSNNSIQIRSLWEQVGGKVYNSIAIHQSVVKDKEVEKFPGIPIMVRVVAGTPEGAMSEGDTTYIARKVDSVIAPNRSEFLQMNRWMSLLMQIVQDTAYPDLMDYTAEGEVALKDEDVGTGKIHHRRIGETIEVLKRAAAPGFEVNTILNILSQDLQKGGLPEIVHGGLPFEISGFMGSQLFSAIKYKLNSRMLAMRQTISYVGTELIRQFRSSGKKLTLTVEKPQRRGKGETYMEEFSKDDVPAATYIDVRLPLSTMVDKAQQMQLARQALTPPQVVSRPTLWEDFLDIQDIDLEYERISDDSVMELPGYKIIMGAAGLRAKAAQVEEEMPESAEALRRYAELLENMVTGQQQGQAQPGGPGPETLPPEFGAGGLSPDVLGAMRGKQPPGGTPGARTRGAESRKGGLWTPGMEK